MAKVDRLVYARFEVAKLDEWRRFVDVVYGLDFQPGPSAGEHEVVVDDQGCRLLFREGAADDLVGAGWISDDLDGLAERLERCGAPVQWLSDDEAAVRGAGRGLRTEDPTGLAVEVLDTTAAHNEFAPARHGQVYKTGELGLGHLTFASKDLDAFERFYTEALGLEVSDYNALELVAGVSVRAGFYRANKRHHSVACASLGVPGQRLNHFFLELPDRTAVGRAYARVKRSAVPLAHRIGVHPNDNLFSFYALSPSGFQAELGAEGWLVEDGWQIQTYEGMSVWGHEMPAAQKLRVLGLALRTFGQQLRERF